MREGELPQGWKRTFLGEVCTFRSGTGFPDAEQGRKKGAYPFIKVSDMSLTGNERTITTANNWIDVDQAKRLGATLHPAGAVVFAKVGAALKLNRRRLLVRPTAIDNNMMSAEPGKNLSSAFLFELMQTKDLGQLCQDGGVPSVNQQHLSDIPILLPPLSVQDQATALLGEWNRAIAAAEALVAAKRRAKRAVFNEIFGSGLSETGATQPLWITRPVSEMFDIKIGGTPRRDTSRFWASGNEGVPWLAISDLNRRYVTNSGEKLTHEGFRSSNAKMIASGTVVMSFKLSIGRCAILHQDMATNEAIAAFSPRGKVSSEFLLELLSRVDWNQFTDQAAKGATLNKAKILELNLTLPDYITQQSIGAAAAEAEREIDLLAHQADLLRRQKRGLMQKLLGGAWSVPERVVELEVAVA
jgi:type I restriction enzyme S subunit